MKQTEIDIIDYGEEIRIVDIRNAATSKELKDLLGFRISSAYCDCRPCYFLTCSGILLVSEMDSVFLKSGKLFKRAEFEKIVSLMKKAGETLSSLIIKAKKGEIKTISI